MAKQLIADGEKDADVLVAKMKENIEKEPLAKIDYVKAVNGLTMQQQKEIKAPMLNCNGGIHRKNKINR